MKLATFCLALAALSLPPACFAGKAMDVCRDANGNAYFTDRGCPSDTVNHGRDFVPDAQTYDGRESIDTGVLNSHERRRGTGRTWEWRQEPGGNR